MFHGFHNILETEKSKQTSKTKNKIIIANKQINKPATTTAITTANKIGKKINKRSNLNEITRFGLKFQLPLAPPHTFCCTCFHIPYLFDISCTTNGFRAKQVHNFPIFVGSTWCRHIEKYFFIK